MLLMTIESRTNKRCELLNWPTESERDKFLQDREEWSGGAAFAVGPGDVIRWPPVGRGV